MQYRRLGKSNLKVSALCLGTMMFGDQTDFDEAANIVASARANGVNFIDTADVYSKGKSEQMVGQLLQGQRHDWILASKLGNPMDAEPNHSHYSRHWILRETDNILHRLETDYLDILYMHRDYHEENLEEAVQALGELIRQGKIRGFGVSNFRGWRIAEIVRLCEKNHVPLPLVCQPYYNLLNRMPEVEILPACASYGLGVVPYSPIARGVLSGKYKPGQQPDADTRAGRGDKRMLETEFRQESLLIAERLQQHVDARGGIKLGQFATAWVLANQSVSSVIAGPRTLAQMEDYYAAVEMVISAEEEVLVDSLVTPGHASTPGYNDPSYPFFGRPVR
jgi:aryl-alcohol dehydrogenase-like predicted oxidoreductase